MSNHNEQPHRPPPRRYTPSSPPDLSLICYHNAVLTSEDRVTINAIGTKNSNIQLLQLLQLLQLYCVLCTV